MDVQQCCRCGNAMLSGLCCLTSLHKLVGFCAQACDHGDSRAMLRCMSFKINLLAAGTPCTATSRHASGHASTGAAPRHTSPACSGCKGPGLAVPAAAPAPLTPWRSLPRRPQPPSTPGRLPHRRLPCCSRACCYWPDPYQWTIQCSSWACFYWSDSQWATHCKPQQPSPVLWPAWR